MDLGPVALSLAAMASGIRVLKPVDVVDAPDITISEYVGRVASQDPA